MELDRNQFHNLINSPHNIRNVCLSSYNSQLQKQLWHQLMQKAIKNERQRQSYGYYERDQSKYQKQRQCLKISNIFSICHTSVSMESEKSKQETKQGSQYLINFMKSPRIIPGVDYQMQENFRICDGTVIVVQVGQINEQILCQIFSSMVRNCVIPVIFLDLSFIKSEVKKINFKKVNCIINQTLQKLKQIFKLAIDRSCIQYQLQDIIKIQNLMFGIIDNWWGFSLNQLTNLLHYPQQQNTYLKNIRLSFQNNIYDPFKKQWKKQDNNQQQKYQKIQIIQLICQLKQIQQNKLIQDKIKEFQIRFLQQLGFKFKQKYKPSQKYSDIMKTNFPISDNILNSIVKLLPSPIQNQKFKIKSFYSGNQKDQIAQLIRKSDVNAPFIAYISKSQEFLSGSFNNRLLMFGRVLSGTYQNNIQLKIIELPISKFRKDNTSKNIKIICLMGRLTIQTNNLCVGNIIFSNHIIGSNKKHFIIIDSSVNLQNYNFNFLQTKLQNTVKMNIAPVSPIDLPKVVQQAKKIHRKTVDVRIQTQDTGQLFMKSSFPSFLEVYSDMINQRVSIRKQMIQNIYKQTITTCSSKIALAKSPNKHNRLYGIAIPLQNNELQLLKSLNCLTQKKEITKLFQQQSHWDLQKQGQIWQFGHQDLKQNILANSFSPNDPYKTYISEIKQSVVCAFQWATKSGVLCQQNVSGVNYRLVDCELVSDSIHRGGGQIIPTARRLFYASSLLGNPTLLQPFQKYTLIIKQNNLQQFYNLCKINQIIYEQCKPQLENSIIISSFKLIDVEIPSAKNICGLFDICYSIKKIDTIWKPTGGLALEAGSKTQEIVRQIRRKKGLNINIPDLDHYMDKF